MARIHVLLIISLIIKFSFGQTVQEVSSWKEILDKYNMDGSIQVYDQSRDQFLGCNPGRWDTGFLPASTFKIANSLIGLETGVIDTNYIFRWDGKSRRLSQWEQDMDLKKAFHLSCVPCYQEMARKIGAKRMNQYLDTLGYGNMDVHAGNIDLFWLEGNSLITTREQMEFIRQLYKEELPLSPLSMKIVRAIMIQEETPDYSLSGKTGWSIRNGNNYGWFVGYLEKGLDTFFIVVQIEPKDKQKVGDFAIARKAIAMEIFKEMGLIK